MRLQATEMGQGAALVLLHGLFGAAQNWGAIQKHLAVTHRVIALDLRNHGASPHAATMDYAAMADDVAETLDALGVPVATVLGHSMGGKVAMWLALTQPARVARLIVADIAPVPRPPELRDKIAAMRAIPLRSDLSRREADALLAPAVPDARERGFLLQSLRFEHDPPRWRLNLAAIADSMPAIEGYAPPPGARYDGPTLFLLGETSRYVLPAHHAVIQALFPAARIETIARAGHWLHAENPRDFTAAVVAFLGG